VVYIANLFRYLTSDIKIQFANLDTDTINVCAVERFKQEYRTAGKSNAACNLAIVVPDSAISLEVNIIIQ